MCSISMIFLYFYFFIDIATTSTDSSVRLTQDCLKVDSKEIRQFPLLENYFLKRNKTSQKLK